MNFLTIETTCDETAAAVVNDDLKIRSSVIASQDELHEKFHGVVPEIAARAHVERILPVIDEALKRADISLQELSAIAVANEPGLSGSLLVGLSAAKALALATGLPLIAVNHLHAHIYACQIAAGKNIFPCLGLIVSGGHTTLFHCESAISFKTLGGTIDDAAGEAFDKVAIMLGFPYPGGPHVSRAAEQGNPKAHRFPRTFLNDPARLQFSFSGLKTAVLYKLLGPGNSDLSLININEQERNDIAASFEAAVVDCLAGKTAQALCQTKLSRLCVGGGVAANQQLRKALEQQCEELGVELFLAPPELCTDNAAMGAIAVERFRAGLLEDLDLDIVAGLVR